jgi:hypothetical protein
LAPYLPAKIYTDRADVSYYVGKDSLYQQRHQIRTVLDPKAPGIFVIADKWSKVYNGLTVESLGEEKPVLEIIDYSGRKFTLFLPPRPLTAKKRNQTLTRCLPL